MALFITFEGGEGSGKSLQARALYRRLDKLAVQVILTHEPGGTLPGERVGRLLKWAKHANISPLAELLLFNASRAQLVAEVIRPHLGQGGVVICDRFTDSTIAYQSYGRGLDLALVTGINKVATQGLKPDLTVLLDLPVTVGFARKRARRPDRFEREEMDFHRRVRHGYLELAAGETERWLVLDADQTRAKLSTLIWQRVSRLLPSRGS